MRYEDQVQMLSPNAKDKEPGDDAKEGEEPKTAMIALSARAGGNPFTSDFWQNLNVGHAWVDIRRPDKKKDSWGFTVKGYNNFPTNAPWRSVEGEVLNPDGSTGATGALPEKITATQLENGEKWANAQRGQQYNLFSSGGLSCASFAVGMYEATTGKKAPSSLFGAMIANPTSISSAVTKEVEKRRLAKVEAGEGTKTDAGAEAAQIEKA